MPAQRKYSFLISGGGTGGHIFPALAIADELKKRFPDATIHFVGALGRMEMEKVPQHGYAITGLPISGLNRQQMLKNLAFPIKLYKSLSLCKSVLKDKKPDVVIGTGGFASGPLLWQAQRYGIPTVIQEQNSYPGVTNKLLSKKAKTICVAYDKLERWFPSESIVKTGNPIRESVLQPLPNKADARAQFGLAPNKPTILILGGSLGARAINQAINAQLPNLLQEGNQLLWQCGKLYEKEYVALSNSQISVQPFVNDMNAAFAAADVIISRAGAGSLSELAVIGKPTIVVPSPNVAEDHQTHNAQAYAEKGAAILLPETQLGDLSNIVLRLLNNKEESDALGQNLKALALPNATKDIADQILKLLK